MRIAVVGTGYVGLVTGTCLAESGNEVVGVDINAEKICLLQRGQSPIYEPGLAELLQRNLEMGRLSFTTHLPDAVQDARCIFIAVGTPQDKDGSADLSNLWSVVAALAPCLRDDQVVVIKSTVPVGTNAAVADRLAQLTDVRVHVASNPEFLKEGSAIHDFTRPDRVVVGVRDQDVDSLLHELYAPFLRTEHPFLVMNPESAEMTKYVANAMLATKISFINEMANLCERTGADINEVRRGIGHDNRIGFSFLFPGAGYGGSCFPKDVRALIATSQAVGFPPSIIQAVEDVNEAQKEVLFKKIYRHYKGRLAGLTFAIWGLAFKPCTDDIREAPALVLIDQLLRRNVRLRVHDPVAMPNVRTCYGDCLVYCDRAYDALEEADGLVIVTEWNEFRNPDFTIMHRLLRRAVIFDGRNLYDTKALTERGFTYYYIGQSVSDVGQAARYRVAA
jgi:UDPglucose 6-dehydrogenase